MELVEAALEQLSSFGLSVVEISKFYRTPAFPAGSGPDFVNGAVLCETSLSPKAVIAALHTIEADLGRVRKDRWEARVIDLDLIDYAGVILPDVETHSVWRGLTLTEQMERAPDQLILPHPRVQDRPFVLVPMHDIAPNWVHPVTGQIIVDLIGKFTSEELTEIQPLPHQV